MTKPTPARSRQPPRAEKRRVAILDAATDVFLQGGYLGTNMDDVAAVSGVSKQTIYKHFGSKEALFVEIVVRMSGATGDEVHDTLPPLEPGEDVAAYLRTYAERQLTAVLTPRIMQLRRLVIGEVARFPDLARALYEHGPQRAMAAQASLFARLTEQGHLRIDDPDVAAAHFNWLVMSSALNRAMLLGDDAIPAPEELRRHAEEGVRVFLAAYGAR